MEPLVRPDIFVYQDFRLWLSRLFDYLNQQDPTFSKSEVCRKMGLVKTRSYFHDILNGKTVTKPKVEDLIRVFELSKPEAKYFRLLVNFNQATDSREEREWYYEKLMALSKAPSKLMHKQEFDYYKEWYYPVVRALLHVYDVGQDFSALVGLINPPITLKQAEEAMRVLIRLQLVQLDEHGFWRPAQKALTTGPKIQDEVVRQFQLKCLDAAQRALMRTGISPHRAITRTVSVSEKGFQSLMRRMEEFSAEIGNLVHADQDSADRVYQIDLFFFPCAKPRKLP